MVSENDFMEASEDEEEREDGGICWNVYFKRIRVALRIEAKDVVGVFEFAPGPLITANIVHRWGLGSHQLKYRPMTLLDFDRFTQGLPSYVARRSLTEARAEEERRAAEELSARRKASAQKRKDTIAAKKAQAITSEARQAWVASLEAAEELEEAEKIANEEMEEAK
jgi:hypothetical protein